MPTDNDANKLTLDLICCNGPNIFLQLASHMTGLKLQSDLDAQIPLQVINWSSFLPKVTRPYYPSQGWGLGTRLLVMIRYIQFILLPSCS